MKRTIEEPVGDDGDEGVESRDGDEENATLVIASNDLEHLLQGLSRVQYPQMLGQNLLQSQVRDL